MVLAIGQATVALTLQVRFTVMVRPAPDLLRLLAACSVEVMTTTFVMILMVTVRATLRAILQPLRAEQEMEPPLKLPIAGAT